MEEEIKRISKLIQEQLSEFIGVPLTPEKYNELKEKTIDALLDYYYKVEINYDKCTDDTISANVILNPTPFLINLELDLN